MILAADGLVLAASSARSLTFREVRGQPQEIRFQRADRAWSHWEPFKPTMALPTDAPSASFQLKSRLGVASPAYPIKDGSQ